MARISCSCLFGSAFTVLLWLIVSALFIIPSISVGRNVYSAFYGPGAGVYRPTGVEQMSNELLCTPMWQKPFDYGVKVYASLEQDAFSNPQEFFGSAQLLWHSESVNLDNHYPKLATTAAVDIPSTLYSADSINSTLYAHIFIQATDNLVPHPDVHDTSLVHSTAHLARWRPISKLVNCTDNRPRLLELVAATKIPWATILENHTYKLKELPSYISKVSVTFGVDGSTRSMYKPPVFENTFTESRSEVESLAQQNDDGSTTYDSNTTHFVQLKLQGIHSGWVQSFMQMFKSYTGDVNTTTTKFGISLANLTQVSFVPNPGFLIPVCPSYGLGLLDRSLKLQLIARFMFLLSMPAKFFKNQATLELWLSSKSKWCGVSRISAFVGISGIFLKSSIEWYTKSNTMPLLWMGVALSVLFKLANFPDDLWKFPSYFSEKLALYRLAAAHNSSDDNNNLELTTIRRSVDYAVFKWICGLGLPVIIAMTLHIIFYSKEHTLSMPFIVEFVRRIAEFCNYIWFLPQMVLNHAACSGLLISPAISIGFFCSKLMDLGQQYVTLTAFTLTYEELVNIVVLFIFVVQLIVYR